MSDRDGLSREEWHERREMRQRDEALQEQLEMLDEDRQSKEKADTTKLGVPIKPGYSSHARRLGCEDEYDDAMQCRYGDGW